MRTRICQGRVAVSTVDAKISLALTNARREFNDVDKAGGHRQLVLHNRPPKGNAQQMGCLWGLTSGVRSLVSQLNSPVSLPVYPVEPLLVLGGIYCCLLRI